MTLPDGWADATLDEVADIVRGVTYKKDDARYVADDNLVPLARATNIQNGQLDREELVYVPTDCVSDAQFLRSGDVLVATSSGSKTVVGKAACASARHEGMAFGAFCGVVRPVLIGSRNWIARVFETPTYREFVESVAIGTNINNLRTRDLQSYRLPLPPAAEQRRIVAKLDALTARLARARTELDRVPVLAQRLREKALLSEFLPDTRGSVPMAALLSDVRYGTAQKCDYDGGESPVLRIPNVQSGKIDLSDIKSATFTAKEIDKLSLYEGDILVIRSNGSLDLVGRSAVVEENAAGMLYAGYLIRLRCVDDLAMPKFLHHYLASPVAREALTGGAKSTSGVNNVNAQQLQALQVPVRTIEEQQEIVVRLNNIFARADRLEAEATRARALIDRLEASILAKAFRGELVPQDPADEPASVLLDRIRAQRAAAPKAKRGRRSKEVADA